MDCICIFKAKMEKRQTGELIVLQYNCNTDSITENISDV